MSLHAIEEGQSDLFGDRKYQLFVSYASEDGNEVSDICRVLEKKYKLTCLQFERDFIPGRTIEDNINEGISISEKVLIFMSPNYINKMWCMDEAKHAYDIAYKSRKFTEFIIPVLLRPVDSELPPYLRFCRYIDCQKEENVAARINDAFYNPAITKIDFEGQIVDESKQNGARLSVFSPTRVSNYCLAGPAYQFNPPKEQSKKKFHKHNIKCEEQLEEIIRYVNGNKAMQSYGLYFPGSYQRLIKFLAFLLGIFIWLFITFIVKSESNEWLPFSYDFGMGLASIFVGFLVCGLYTCIICRKKSKIILELRNEIWQINKKHIDKTKCIIELEKSRLYVSLINEIIKNINSQLIVQ